MARRPWPLPGFLPDSSQHRTTGSTFPCYSPQNTKKNTLQCIYTTCTVSFWCCIKWYFCINRASVWGLLFFVLSSINPKQLLYFCCHNKLLRQSLKTTLTFKELLQGFIFSHHIHDKPGETFCFPAAQRVRLSKTRCISSRWSQMHEGAHRAFVRGFSWLHPGYYHSFLTSIWDIF